jgi:hypothetical protein
MLGTAGLIARDERLMYQEHFNLHMAWVDAAATVASRVAE